MPLDPAKLGAALGEPGLPLHSSLCRRQAGAFQQAIAENDYKGSYRGVYPIKVNQQRHVVEELVDYGRPFNLGIEAGSKPELLVALAVHDNPEALILCNGYKDRAFIETALLAQKLGRKVIITVDRMGELETIIRSSRELDLRPVIGVRARLSTKGAGKWVESTGDRSKFGLTTAEMVTAVERLRAEGMLDCLQLLHFHLGSQITNIRNIKGALNEAARTYTELVRLGAGMKYLDVGGGLGIDYDGSQTDFESSVNYTLQEYANDVVFRIQSVCDECNVPHPTIISESGRGVVAYHSVLVFDVLGGPQQLPNAIPASDAAHASCSRASVSLASRTARSRYMPPSRSASRLPRSLHGFDPWLIGRADGRSARTRVACGRAVYDSSA